MSFFAKIIPFFIAILCIAAIFAVQRSKKSRIKKILNRFQGKNILLMDSDAYYLGRRIKKEQPVKTLRLTIPDNDMKDKGILILTERSLLFSIYFFKTEFEIPLDKIIDIKTPMSFMGSFVKFGKLLQVDFFNQKGQEDAVAWGVKDLDKWVSLLKNVNRNS